MLETLKNIMTPNSLEQAKRDAERDLERAENELKARTTDLGKATAEHTRIAAAIEAAQEAFDAEPTDENIHRLLECKRELERSDLFLDRETRREARARAAVKSAEAALAAAQRAILEDFVSTDRVQAQLAPHAGKVAKAIQLLTEAQEGTKAIAREVAAAEHQLGIPNRLGRSTAWVTSGVAAALLRDGDRTFSKARNASQWLEDVRPR